MKMEDHPKLKLFLRKDPLCKQNPHGTNQGEGEGTRHQQSLLGIKWGT